MLHHILTGQKDPEAQCCIMDLFFLFVFWKVKVNSMKSDGIEIPTSPSDGCLEILAAKLGPAVSNLLLHYFNCEDFNLSKGMAHFLNS